MSPMNYAADMRSLMVMSELRLTPAIFDNLLTTHICLIFISNPTKKERLVAATMYGGG